MIDTMKLRLLGYGNQVSKLENRLHANAHRKLMDQATQWAAIGAQVNYSFFEDHRQTSFSLQEIEIALGDIGVSVQKMKGKKWYQIWKKDQVVRIEQAIKSITND